MAKYHIFNLVRPYKCYAAGRVMLILFSLQLSACAGHGVLGIGDRGLTVSCESEQFSFVVFSDNYGGQDSGLRRVAQDAVDRDPNVRFLTSAGDTPSFQRVRGVIDQRLNRRPPCGADVFPWFPATGNHDAESQQNMEWWATKWAAMWESDPAQSRLATQLPGLDNFRRGPLHVQGTNGLIKIDPGSIYSFDYKNAHFVFINNYEQDIIADPAAGVWDYNGVLYDPATSQLDWLKEDLQLNTKPFIFVFGHVAILTPCYNRIPPNTYYPCSGPPPPGWSEHNSPFQTTELTRLLAEHNVMAYFHGHDHVPSRILVNMDRSAAYQRLYWDAHNDPARPHGNPDLWQNLQGPGRIWQVDAGLVYNKLGTYVLVKLTEDAVIYEFYRFQGNTPGPTELWDTWTVPTQAYCGGQSCRSSQATLSSKP